MDGLKEKYVSEVIPKLGEQLGMRNVMGMPRIAKVIVNMGVGIADKDALNAAVTDLTKITGQNPMMTKARKSISNFKLREGMIVGAKVTLRGMRMYDFLNRLINAALPRIRDFRGVSEAAFDGRGNYSMGITDQSIFPEIDPNNVSVTQGMDITIVTSTDDDGAARELLRLLGMPFAEKPSATGG